MIFNYQLDKANPLSTLTNASKLLSSKNIAYLLVFILVLGLAIAGFTIAALVAGIGGLVSIAAYTLWVEISSISFSTDINLMLSDVINDLEY